MTINNENPFDYLNIPGWLFEHKKLNNNARVLWSYLNYRQGENDDCWPGVDRIHREIKISVNTVHAARKQLIEAGLIKITQASKGGRGLTCHYKTMQKTDSLEDNRPPINPKNYTENTQLAIRKSDSIGPKTIRKTDGKTKTNITKKGKIKANSSFSISSILISELVDRHIALSPPAQSGKHRRGLLSKCENLLEKYPDQDVRDTIERYSAKGTEGDGWGVILKMTPMIENIRAKETYQAKLAGDREKYGVKGQETRSHNVTPLGDIVSGKPRITLSREDRKQICILQSKMLLAGLNPPTIIEVEQELRKKQKTDNTV